MVHSCCDIVISEELEQNADRTLFITSSGDAVGESAGTVLLLPKLIASKRIGIAYPFLSSGEWFDVVGIPPLKINYDRHYKYKKSLLRILLKNKMK